MKKGTCSSLHDLALLSLHIDWYQIRYKLQHITSKYAPYTIQVLFTNRLGMRNKIQKIATLFDVI